MDNKLLLLLLCLESLRAACLHPRLCLLHYGSVCWDVVVGVKWTTTHVWDVLQVPPAVVDIDPHETLLASQTWLDKNHSS